jgi:hypothetical protein
MKNLRVTIILLVSVFFLSTCGGGDDDWLIVCDHCPTSKPWSVWNLDLSNPCFETKTKCEAWAEGTLPVGWECTKCD